MAPGTPRSWPAALMVLAVSAGAACAAGGTGSPNDSWLAGGDSGASGTEGGGTLQDSGTSAIDGSAPPVDDGAAGGILDGSAMADGGAMPPSDGGGPGSLPPPGDGAAPPGFWDTGAIPAAKNAMTFVFLNRTNGKYKDSDVYWSFKHTTAPVVNELHSIADMPTYDMPANGSGRMYFYVGGSASQYNDFIEFTIGNAFNGNTTRVDAFGLPIAIRLHCADGYDIAVGDDYGLFQEDRTVTFQHFIDEVPAEFKHLAMIQAPYKIVQPGAGEFKTGGLYAQYYDAYVNQVWTANGYTTPKPGPNGSGLGAQPALSASLYRHVAHLPMAQWKDSTQFYQAAPANYYAKFWHTHGLLGRAYGFPYDDVYGWSSYISHTTPQYLLVAIGF